MWKTAWKMLNLQEMIWIVRKSDSIIEIFNLLAFYWYMTCCKIFSPGRIPIFGPRDLKTWIIDENSCFCCPFKFLLMDQEEDIETKLQSKNQINRTNIKAKNPVLRKCWLSKKRNANCGVSTEPLHCRKKDFGFMFYPWIPINPPITQSILVTPMIPFFWFLHAFALNIKHLMLNIKHLWHE